MVGLRHVTSRAPLFLSLFLSLLVFVTPFVVWLWRWPSLLSYSGVCSAVVVCGLPVVVVVFCSDVQGFINPHGYAGRGQGIGTLTKSLPSTWVGGHPQLFVQVGVARWESPPRPGNNDGQFSGQWVRRVVWATVV